MITKERRAAIYIKDPHVSTRNGVINSEQLLGLICRYCAMHGYQLCEEHIYQANGELLGSDAPQMVRLRIAAFQGEFEILIVPSLASIGMLPPWKSIPLSRAVDGFYACQVRVESVIPRNGTHDVRQQVLLEAINFVKWSMQEPSRRGYPHRKQQEENQ